MWGRISNDYQGIVNVYGSSEINSNIALVGGGFNNGGYMSIDSSNISLNSGTQFGGGIENDATLILTNSNITNNNAQYGGGIDNFVGNLISNNSNINNNTGEYGGGNLQ